MRIVQTVFAVSIVAIAGLGFASARAEQTPKAGTTVVVYKSPT